MRSLCRAKARVMRSRCVLNLCLESLEHSRISRFRDWAKALGVKLNQWNEMHVFNLDLVWRGKLVLTSDEMKESKASNVEVVTSDIGLCWPDCDSEAYVLKVLASSSYSEVRHMLVPSRGAHINFLPSQNNEAFTACIRREASSEVQTVEGDSASTCWLVSIESMVDEKHEAAESSISAADLYWLHVTCIENAGTYPEWRIWRVDQTQPAKILFEGLPVFNSGMQRHSASLEKEGLAPDKQCQTLGIYGVNETAEIVSKSSLDQNFISSVLLYSSMEEIFGEADVPNAELAYRDEPIAGLRRGSDALALPGQSFRRFMQACDGAISKMFRRKLGKSNDHETSACDASKSIDKRKLSEIVNAREAIEKHVEVVGSICGGKRIKFWDEKVASSPYDMYATPVDGVGTDSTSPIAFQVRPWLRPKEDVIVKSAKKSGKRKRRSKQNARRRKGIGVQERE